MKHFDSKFKTLILFCILSLLTSHSAYSQKQNKVVLHINNPLKMTMLVKNVKNLRKMLGEDATISVVVNGPAVARFSAVFSSRFQVDEILQQNTSINICSFALKNKRIKKTQLFDGINYLEDGGVAELVKLQQKGFAYIKP